jgi:hypothetical protein
MNKDFASGLKAWALRFATCSLLMISGIVFRVSGERRNSGFRRRVSFGFQVKVVGMNTYTAKGVGFGELLQAKFPGLKI